MHTNLNRKHFYSLPPVLRKESRWIRDLITKKLRRLRISIDSPGSFQTKKKPETFIQNQQMFIHQKQTIDYRYAHCDCKSQNLREVQNQAFVYLLWWICEFDIDCWFGILNPASSKPVKLPGVNGCFQGMYIFPLLELLNVALPPKSSGIHWISRGNHHWWQAWRRCGSSNCTQGYAQRRPM